ncbi:hypothetical protein AB0G05_38775 [Nonomuraea wenchangensis]
MVLFADHACEDRSSAVGSQVVGFGHLAGGLRCDVREPLSPGPVRTVLAMGWAGVDGQRNVANQRIEGALARE